MSETVYLRRRSVADRYDTTPRNVNRMVLDGRLPPPDMYNGVNPLWSKEALDRADREAMKRGRQQVVGVRKAVSATA